MLKMLIVEDYPRSKVDPALKYLDSIGLKFESTLFDNICEAQVYIRDNKLDIDMVIVDLGLPWAKGGFTTDLFSGLTILDEMKRQEINLPIIVNSDTEMPKEKMEPYESYFTVIKKVDRLDGDWLLKFLEENLESKIEC